MSGRDPALDLPPAPPPSLRQRAAYLRYLTVWETAAHAPEALARRLPAQLGRAWYLAAPRSQRTQVRANLARIRPGADEEELRRLVREAYVHYARYWIDAFRLHRMDGAAVVAASTAEGLAYVDAVRDAGRGGIFATAHLGSWDVGAFFTTQRRWGMVVVAEVVEPRALFDRFVRLREQAGIGVIPLVRGGDMLGRLERAVVEDGALATLLADRDLTRHGPVVEFFGEPCRLPAGPAALARRTGLPVHVGAFLAAGDGFHGVVHAPIEVAHLDVYDGTQAVAEELEHLIARFPTQWHVFVRNWLADREPDHPVVAAWRSGGGWRALAREERRATSEGEQR